MSENVTGAEFNVPVFEEFVKSLIEEHNAPGLAVGVISGGNVVYCRGFGYRDLDKKLPVTENTVFGIASVSKSFTALGILQLSEKGLVSIEHPVKRYLPELGLPDPAMADRVTIHNFLTHTSGIPPLPSLDYAIIESTPPDEKDKKELESEGVPEKRPSMKTPEDLMKFIATHEYKLLGVPGQYLSYSNDAYGLLGTIIERVSGKDYETYLRENILDPLEMDHTTTLMRKVKSFPDVTELYYKDKEDKLCTTKNWQEAPALTACGFLRSNVKDLLKYVQMYLGRGVYAGRRIASGDSISRMITPYYPYVRDSWYGYGFSVRPAYGPGVTLVQHSGLLRGVASNLGFVPEKGIGAVVLCNLSGFPSSKVWLGAVNLLLGLPVDHPITEAATVEIPESRMARISGRYKSGEGADIKISVQGKELVAEMDSKTYPLRMTGPDTAVVTIKGVDSHLRFLFDPDGKVWAMGYGSRIIYRA
ncbi:MAG TPA: beta-lactamase family protein [Firmicutes bacterium]|nr:beta-lactamase family protein [Candidatus Fermentithermobacillaceae bacterium]